jgi:chromosome segregation protein
VEQVETRINGLNNIMTEVERKLSDQIARRGELDTLKNQIDTLGAQTVDAQQKLESVNVLQDKLLPMTSQLATLKTDVDKAFSNLKAVQREDGVLDEQEKRLTVLVESTRAMSNEVAERQRQIQSVSEELTRGAAIKEELITELAGVQARQRDTIGQIEASDDQLKRIETMFKQLEQRRSQLVFAEKKITAFETRLSETKQLTEHLDRQVEGIAARQVIVSAVKAEVESVHEIGARSKADLQYVAEHRNDVAALKSSVDEVLSHIGQTEEKIAVIQGRKKLVDEVEAKTTMITNLLADVRINLETLSEHKALADHLSERLARLDFMVQEAQNTLRTLQRERELAERIEQSIRQLRARTTGKPEQTGTA